MELKLFQVDAFASRVFEGNPAAVVPLDAWPDDSLLQCIAEENNLSETAFFVPLGGGYRLRWFTPQAEVDLCGHATLAAAHVLFEHLGHPGGMVEFDSRSGALRVKRVDGGLQLDFPAIACHQIEGSEALAGALGASPEAVFEGADLMAVFASKAQVHELQPDFSALSRLPGRGVIVTAPGADCDFVSRCFFPKLRVEEDPVTGSAHCQLAPYWAERLGRERLLGKQLSARGGEVICETAGERVRLTGRAVDYLIGTLRINDAVR
jgi:PhzF family phenazine biosynthesis protein